MKTKLFFSLCFAMVTGLVWAQTGKVRTFSDFSGLRISGPFDVYLEQGDAPQVRIDGDNEAVEKIETELDGNTLRIRLKDEKNNWKWWNDHDDIKVYVTYRSLRELHVSGSGDIFGRSPIRSESFEVRGSGSGDIELADVQTDHLEVSMSGSGDLEIAGRAREQDLRVSGSGDIEAFGLKSERAHVSISGSSDINLNVSESLEASVSGSGDIRYKGQPRIERMRVSGSGEIRQAN
ncbi:Putative auto-transporter adhesin, head GIN domain [Catalinimonas alkaloidigena]|uniref:Putative auto-transporter adhesin, head GIN domain n=1 Tax=Catalinimonas alkaloidigena TaxID=1075417 RepID=A0A1G8YBM3_9BACT|nr:head GIN domain-containing protein [Catalinimonas alkaloidigena]SDJ99460.1 Putative auto-transporter adhesin, head GIN domain [Catalinimonas alkaloidigena]